MFSGSFYDWISKFVFLNKNSNVFKNFDVTCHKNALKSRQTRYPSVASVISSAIIRVPEDTNQCGFFQFSCEVWLSKQD